MANPVAERILAEAKAEADQIVDKAKQDADALLADARARTQTDVDAILEDARNKARQRAEGILADARLSVRMKELAARREIMDQVLNQALQRVQALDADAFREVAARMIEENRFDGDQELATSPDDSDVWNAAFLAQLNQSLGDRATVTLATDPGVSRRSFFIRQDRKQVECSGPSALRARREEIEEEIAKFLFGERE